MSIPGLLGGVGISAPRKVRDNNNICAKFKGSARFDLFSGEMSFNFQPCLPRSGLSGEDVVRRPPSATALRTEI